MEDDLTYFSNGRRPHFIIKWKTTSFYYQMEDDHNFFENEKRPQYFSNGRLHQYFGKWKRPSIFWKLESRGDNLNFLIVKYG